MLLSVIFVLYYSTAVQNEHITLNCFDEVAHLIKTCQSMEKLNQSESFFKNDVLQSPETGLRNSFQLNDESTNSNTKSQLHFASLSDICQKMMALVYLLVNPEREHQFTLSTTHESRYSVTKDFPENTNNLESEIDDFSASGNIKLSPATYEARYSPLNVLVNNPFGSSDFFVRGRIGSLYGSGRDEDRSIGPRIVGGTVANSDEIPYQVALYKLDIFVCGSSLISQYYVLTAAHCLRKASANQLWFRVGSKSLTHGGQTYRVASFVAHEGYSNADNDIALIRSASAVEFGPGIKAIALPKKNDPIILPGTTASISGWGVTEKTNGQLSYRLNKLEIKLTSRKRCRNRIMASIRTITERQICTTASIYAGTCFGDSGGPLVVNKELVGIVSWGSPCAIGDPDVYTNIQAFLPWIYQQIKRLNRRNDLTFLQAASMYSLPNDMNYDLDQPVIYY